MTRRTFLWYLSLTTSLTCWVTLLVSLWTLLNSICLSMWEGGLQELNPGETILQPSPRRLSWEFWNCPHSGGCLDHKQNISKIKINCCRFLDVNYTGHKGYTDSTGAFYIYLDTNSSLVCSGSEDSAAYVWDRRFGCLLSRNTHDNVVNCVAFNPQDPEMLVSVGDDMKVKIWISKQRERELRLTESPHKRTKTSTEWWDEITN